MLYKKLSFVVVLSLIAAAAIFGLRSWVASDAPQSAATSSTTTPAPSIPTTVPPSTPAAIPKPSPKPKPKPTVRPNTKTRPAVKHTSTRYIVTGVTSALNARSPISTRVVCPPTIPLVAQAVITCNVYDLADKGDVALARVTVRLLDRSGRFTWKSVSLR